MDEELAAEIKDMQEHALEIFKTSRCSFFRANLMIDGVYFRTDNLSAEEISKLYPSLMGNLYIQSVEGYTAQGWETI
jgi:hypothetical protein